jgi:twitching motility protein PilT
MSFVSSLLQAIVRLEGEAVVLHVGEKPYVVTPSGQVDLATRGLTFEAVTGIINQLLPVEALHALEELGAAQYQLPPMTDLAGEQFTIVAARGGDDIWAEIRRRRVVDDRIPMELFGEPAPAVGEDIETLRLGDEPEQEPRLPGEPFTPITMDHSKPFTTPAGRAASVEDDLQIPDVDQLWPSRVPDAIHDDHALHQAPAVAPPPMAPPPVGLPTPPPAPAAFRESPDVAPVIDPWPTPAAPAVAAPTPAKPAPPPPSPAVVLPLTRTAVRSEDTVPHPEQSSAAFDRLLRLASSRGASILYVSSDVRPAVRLDGDVQTLDDTSAFSAAEVESLLLSVVPERNVDAFRSGLPCEWTCDLPELGRIRCMTFRDHRGPGGVFRLMPARPLGAEQLGLSREIQSLATEPEGLVLIAGPRASGKRTLMSALVDLVNRARHDHVISLESEITVAHERKGSYISQREVHGGSDEMLMLAQAALREDPDVLVLEEVRTPGLVNLALDAAAAGRLVIAGYRSHNAVDAIERIIDLYPPEVRRQLQLSLAQNLRAVVSQVLLRKAAGGRVAAREVLLNSPVVRSVLAEARTSQLPLAIEGGRAQGMMPLNDAIAAHVQSGAVDVREAYRWAADRAGLLALLKRRAVDTSAIERYA